MQTGRSKRNTASAREISFFENGKLILVDRVEDPLYLDRSVLRIVPDQGQSSAGSLICLSESVLYE